MSKIEYRPGTQLISGVETPAVHIYRHGCYYCTCSTMAEAKGVVKVRDLDRNAEGDGRDERRQMGITA